MELLCSGIWRNAGEDVFKVHNTQTACFTTVLPAAADMVPEKLRLTCHCMGRTGIAFAEVVLKESPEAKFPIPASR